MYTLLCSNGDDGDDDGDDDDDDDGYDDGGDSGNDDNNNYRLASLFKLYSAWFYGFRLIIIYIYM